MSNLRLIANHTATIIVLTLVLKPIGILRDIMVANYFGVSPSLGTFFIFYGIAIFLTSMLYAMQSGTVTPIYIRLREEKKQSQAMSLAIASGLAYFGLLAGFCCLVFLLGDRLIGVFAPGMPVDQRLNAVQYIPWVAWITLAVGAVQFFTSLLEAEQQFVTTRLLQAVVPTSVVAGIFFWNDWGWSILFPSLVFGSGVVAIVEAACFFAMNRRYAWRLDLRSTHLRAVIGRWPAMMVGSVISDSTSVVDRMMISLLGTHQVAVYGYAETLYSNLSGLIIGALSSAVLPVFSKIFTEDKDKLANTLFGTFSYMVALLLPIALFVAVFGNEIVSLLYQRGNFHAEDAEAVAWVLRVLVFDLIPLAGIVLYSRVLHVLTDVRVTFLAGVIQAALNVGLDYVFMLYYGLTGIVLATLAVNTVMLLFLAVVLAAKHKIVPAPSQLLRLFWLALVALCVGVSAIAYKPYGVAAMFASFVFSYALIVFAFQISEYMTIWNMGYGWLRRSSGTLVRAIGRRNA